MNWYGTSHCRIFSHSAGCIFQKHSNWYTLYLKEIIRGTKKRKIRIWKCNRFWTTSVHSFAALSSSPGHRRSFPGFGRRMRHRRRHCRNIAPTGRRSIVSLHCRSRLWSRSAWIRRGRRLGRSSRHSMTAKVRSRSFVLVWCLWSVWKRIENVRSKSLNGGNFILNR
jgi:hypothetical protein